MLQNISLNCGESKESVATKVVTGTFCLDTGLNDINVYHYSLIKIKKLLIKNQS
jgi:hypothetical protein